MKEASPRYAVTSPRMNYRRDGLESKQDMTGS